MNSQLIQNSHMYIYLHTTFITQPGTASNWSRKACRVKPDVALITLDHAAAGWSIAVAVAFVRKWQQRLLANNASDVRSDVILQQLRRCWITYT